MLAEDPDRRVSDVAKSLGIRADLIYRWRKELQNQENLAFPGRGNQSFTEEQRKIKELEKKLIDAEMERDILKKALAIFSKAPK
jgi:transposase-like protein